MAKSKRVETYINSSEPPKKSRRGVWAFFIFCLLVAGSAFAGYRYILSTFSAPGPSSEPQVFSVPKGAGLSTIAAKLEKENLIENADLFKLMMKIEGKETGLKAGEFEIPAAASMETVFATLHDGKAILYPFTAPEGLTSAQIMRGIARVETLVDDNPEIPEEGTLLPETYLTPRGMKRSALVEKMKKAQTDFIDSVWDYRHENLPIKTKEEAIILASVVEKETGVTSERDRVAGVFINRLNRGMRLESDPTIIYGINGGERLGRGIRRSEINRKTDWNTYQMDGLPKTPICNPGKDAIMAVLQPAETSSIFFVADGTGGHAFADTLAGHNRNVKKWRKIERQRKANAQ